MPDSLTRIEQAVAHAKARGDVDDLVELADDVERHVAEAEAEVMVIAEALADARDVLEAMREARDVINAAVSELSGQVVVAGAPRGRGAGLH